MASRTATASEKVTFPNLDGLRFFCFLAVFLFHGFYTESSEVARSFAYLLVRQIVRHGDLGVSFFFVLSGFLITYLLLEEKRRNGGIHVPFFYVRRILRIWPLYIACVAFGFLGFPLLKGLVGLPSNETANPLMYLLFLSNFDVLANGLPDAGVLGVLWSVAVEEQFYLAWPLLLAAVPLGRELRVLLPVLVASVAFRAAQSDTNVLTFHTLGLVGDMAVGGLAAFAAVNSPAFIDWFAGLPRAFIWCLYALAAALLLVETRFLRPFDRFVPALTFISIILEQNYARASLFKLGSSRLLTHLGQRTYGMYCLHMIGNVAALQGARFLHLGGSLWHVLLLVPLASFGLTILMSELSYRYFERPFLRFKGRFQFIARE